MKTPARALLLVVAGLAVLAHATTARGQAMRTPDSKGYAHLNGVELYYEIHGSGPPLVMLHGGVTPSEMYGAPLTEMARTHKVIALHFQGHGFSKDSDRPWSFETFADDVAALMDELGIMKASVMGYSSGALVALQVAIRHPQFVDKLIVISAACRSDGYYPEVREAFAQMPAAAPTIAAGVSKSPLASLYPSVNWETVFRKTGELGSRSYDWSAGVSGITAPTLLIFADADAMRPEHIAEFYKLLGGGQRDAGLDGSLRSPNQLAIIPNTTHLTLLASPAVMQDASAFLEGP
ncbi:MAG TPA: alpha/beta hydrolase [Gemmatimonadaceae bacterium]|nr:alpha/beta hydrolase [Gemmatimonadaceae bacterium]